MAILIVYLTLKGLVSCLHLFIYVIILLFNCYFTSFLLCSLYRTKYVFIHLEATTGSLVLNSCSKSGLKQLKYVCESVLFLLKLQAIDL